MRAYRPFSIEHRMKLRVAHGGDPDLPLKPTWLEQRAEREAWRAERRKFLRHLIAARRRLVLERKAGSAKWRKIEARIERELARLLAWRVEGYVSGSREEILRWHNFRHQE